MCAKDSELNQKRYHPACCWRWGCGGGGGIWKVKGCSSRCWFCKITKARQRQMAPACGSERAHALVNHVTYVVTVGSENLKPLLAPDF